MSTQHDHDHGDGYGHAHVNVSSKSGPARMATAQDDLRKAFARRFRAIRGALRTTVIDNDALHLRESSPPPGQPRRPRDVLNDADDVDAAESFPFATDPDRLSGFREWFDETIDVGLVEPLPDDAVREGRHYTADHVTSAYRDGLQWADVRAREAGIAAETASIEAVIRRPPHQESLEVLYSRTFDELEGIGDEMARDMNRILADGLQAGENPRVIGDRMAGELRDIQRGRGRRVARTEVMNAFHQGNGTRMQELGVQEVRIATRDPCPLCIALREGGPYTVEEAMGALPRHPNCYAGDTAVYTDRGWVHFADLTGDEVILALDPESGGLTTGWLPYEAEVSYHFTGELIRLVSDAIDVAVTPDHTSLIGVPRDDGDGIEWRLERTADAIERSAFYIPSSDPSEDGPLRLAKYDADADWGVSIERVPYDGRVYDVQLPKWHVLWTRRSGKTAWSGNCVCVPVPTRGAADASS